MTGSRGACRIRQRSRSLSPVTSERIRLRGGATLGNTIERVLLNQPSRIGTVPLCFSITVHALSPPSPYLLFNRHLYDPCFLFPLGASIPFERGQQSFPRLSPTNCTLYPRANFIEFLATFRGYEILATTRDKIAIKSR